MDLTDNYSSTTIESIMTDLKINCPNCNQKLQLPESLCGQEIECPLCKTIIKVPVATLETTKTPQISITPSVKSSPSASKSKKSTAKATSAQMMNRDKDLHDFLSTNVMLGLSVVFLIPLLLSSSALGVPFLFIHVFFLALTVFINGHFFRKGADWVCGRDIESSAALLTVFFSNSIAGLVTGIIGLIVGDIFSIFIVILLITNAIIFELRLREGFGKAMLISLIIFVIDLLIALLFCGVIFAVGMGVAIEGMKASGF